MSVCWQRCVHICSGLKNYDHFSTLFPHMATRNFFFLVYVSLTPNSTLGYPYV